MLKLKDFVLRQVFRNILSVGIFLQKEVGTVGYFLHPVRNDAPLVCSPACGGIRSQNNSGGVGYPAGISNGVHSIKVF